MNNCGFIHYWCILFLLSVIFFFFSCDAVCAVAVGVSPAQLIFPENTIHLLNSNPYHVSFSISGCENFSLQRSGQITAYSMYSILIYPPTSNYEECLLFVELESGVLSYGLAIPVTYDLEVIEQQSLSKSSSLLTGFFVEDSIQPSKNANSLTSNSIFIIVVCICFAFALFFIIRYV